MSNRVDPHQRKEELLNASAELFLKQGYRETSVNSIVKSIDVSKGTFYYYFDSKEDVLDGLAEKISQPIYRRIDEIIEDQSISAIDKLNRIFSASGQIKLENIENVMNVARLMYSPNNVKLRDKILSVTLTEFSPRLADVLRQGVDEGAFDTPYPDEISRIILHMGTDIGRQLFAAFLDPAKEIDPERIKRNYRAYEGAIERVLGAPEGSVDVVDQEVLEEFLTYLMEIDTEEDE